MKKLLLCLLSFFTVAGYAQNNPGFDKIYNFSGNDSFVSSYIQAAYADSNQYFVGGNTFTPSVSPLHGFLSSFDYNGQLLWYQKLFFPGQYNAFFGNAGVTKAGKDRYVIGGNFDDYNVNPQLGILQPYLYFFKANGDSILFRNYIDSFQDRLCTSLTIDKQNNIIATGYITSVSTFYDSWAKQYDHDSAAVWVSKYDTVGNILWQKSFSYQRVIDQSLGAYKVAASNNGRGYVIAGYSCKLNNNCAAYVIKADTAGNLVWRKELPIKNPSDYTDVDVIAAPDSGYYFAATFSPNPYNPQAPIPSLLSTFYGKLNENGDTVWTRKFNRDNIYLSAGSRIALDNQKNLIISMKSRVPATIGITDSFYYDHSAFIKTDSLGNVMWYREPEHFRHFTGKQDLVNLSITPTDKILMTGYIQKTQDSMISWMVLTDSMGMRYPGDTLVDNPVPLIIPETNIVGDVSVFPNPVYNTLYVRNDIAGKLKMEIATIEGKLLMEKELNGAAHEQVNMQHLMPGMYLVRIIRDGRCLKTYRISHLN